MIEEIKKILEEKLDNEKYKNLISWQYMPNFSFEKDKKEILKDIEKLFEERNVSTISRVGVSEMENTITIGMQEKIERLSRARCCFTCIYLNSGTCNNPISKGYLCNVDNSNSCGDYSQKGV